ncbi:MAG: PH domain-containing protein [Candidatus Pacebacteria bacterium]|jgi:uncharacterized membrane protein YdbT with pleckstrin-like domain|nr:PH domain-containing protein [Candidatus Paceibacterota bacterium]|tara:strand:- start:21689 stop:22216 length:528 start_codon:yes stop_codon:yes gene_type:complete
MIHLSKDERVEKVIRKHWLILFGDSIGLIILYIIPFLIYWYLFDSTITVDFLIDKIYFHPSPSILVFTVSAWTLLAWAKLFAIWTDYYLDMWLITNKRIVDIEQKGFFNRDISTFRMERIQDITVEIKGVIATLLNFGNIHVQTAGESQEFIIKGIGRPKYVKEIIMRQADKVAK